jgi:two-component system sensor histidine kinase AgrC
MMGHELSFSLLMHLYMAVVMAVFLLSFLLKKFLEKYRAINFLSNQIMRFLLISAGIVLVFTFKSFAIEDFNFALGQWTMDFGDVAYMLFVATSIVMFVIILRYVSKEAAFRTEMLLAESSKKYINDLEESYKALRVIKHDYVNILTSFKLYIDNEDMAGLAKYYYNELAEMNKGFLHQDQLMGSLQNIQLNEVKSVLIYKGSIAAQHEIDTGIEVKEPVENLGVSTAIVCQLLGILLDNAIEAASEAGEKELYIAIIKNPSSKAFIIKNTWKKQDIPISKMFELGFSTKANGRGVGLYTARSYTEKLKGLYLETEITDTHFIQTLTVKDG